MPIFWHSPVFCFKSTIGLFPIKFVLKGQFDVPQLICLLIQSDNNQTFPNILCFNGTFWRSHILCFENTIWQSLNNCFKSTIGRFLYSIAIKVQFVIPLYITITVQFVVPLYITTCITVQFDVHLYIAVKVQSDVSLYSALKVQSDVNGQLYIAISINLPIVSLPYWLIHNKLWH